MNLWSPVILYIDLFQHNWRWDLECVLKGSIYTMNHAQIWSTKWVACLPDSMSFCRIFPTASCRSCSSSSSVPFCGIWFAGRGGVVTGVVLRLLDSEKRIIYDHIRFTAKSFLGSRVHLNFFPLTCGCWGCLARCGFMRCWWSRCPLLQVEPKACRPSLTTPRALRVKNSALAKTLAISFFAG